MFMEALNEGYSYHVHLALMWLVALGLLNSVVSAFYYVRVLKAMFLRPSDRGVLSPPPSSIAFPIVLATVVVVGFGIYPAPLVELVRGGSVPMLMPGDRPGYIKHDSDTEPPAPQASPAPTAASEPAAEPAPREKAKAKAKGKARTKRGQRKAEQNPPAPTPVPASKKS
jgi:NADH-quinone oxidoreductase subunit N